MRDRDVVAALVDGEPDGLAALYDGYAEDLYGYCLSLLDDATDAADAVQDTLIVAAAKLGELRSPDRLCPWLYAAARIECYGRLRSWGRPPGPGAAACRIIPRYSTERDVLEQLVRGALAGLSPADREAAELTLWHGLAVPDVASVLGVPPDQAALLAGRCREQLDQALGELLVAHVGRRDCASLDALLDTWDGSMSAQWRRRVSAHADSCDACGMCRFRVLSPDTLASLAPPGQPSPALREHVLDVLCDDDPDAAGYRRRVASRSGPLDLDGFPVQAMPAAVPVRAGGLLPVPASLPGLARLSASITGRTRVAVAAAATLVLLASLVGVATSLLGGGGNGATAAGPARRAEPFGLPRGPAPGGPAASASPSRPGRPAHSRTARPSPSPSASHSTRPAASSSASPHGRQSPAPSAAPSSQPPPSSAGLFESPSDILLEQGAGGGESGMFTLIANQGFAVRYEISAPADAGLSFSAPLSGTVSPGQPLNITVTYTPGAGTSRASGISVNGIAITLTYT